MTPEPIFATPSEHVATARQALSRLEARLGRAIGPLDASTDFGTLLFTSVTLEAADPPYQPLDGDPETSLDPHGDLLLAIDALTAASKQADTARETLRLADVAHQLRELVESRYLTEPVPESDEWA